MLTNKVDNSGCRFCGGLHYGSDKCPYICLKCGRDIRIGHIDTSNGLGRSFICQLATVDGHQGNG